MNLQLVKKYWWIIVMAVCISTAVGMLYTYSQPNIYEARAAYIVNPSVEVADTRDLISSLNSLSSRSSISTTYCGLIESRTAFNQAVAKLGVDSAMAAGYTVSCTVRPDSNIIQVWVRGASPVLTRDLAYILGRTQLDSSIGIEELFSLAQVEEATVVPERVSPRHELNIIVSALVGLLGGVLILSALSALSGFRREPGMVRSTTTLPREQPRPYAAD